MEEHEAEVGGLEVDADVVVRTRLLAQTLPVSRTIVTGAV
jgi:hypothetical protein